MILGLDTFGYPAAYLANQALTGYEDYGDNFKQIHEVWKDWNSYNPFDYNVSEKLAAITCKRLEIPDQDSGEILDLKRVQKLAEARAKAYEELMSSDGP